VRSAGSIETFDAISTREGVIRVRGLDELIETTECFVHADPPKGNRLAAVSLSGGKRGLLIDAFYSAETELCAAEPERHRKNWQDARAPAALVGNPLDACFAAVVDPSVYMQSIKIMIDDPDTDIVIIDSELPKAPHELRRAQLAHRQRHGRRRQQAGGLYQRDVDWLKPNSPKAVAENHCRTSRVMQGSIARSAAIKSLIEYAGLRKEVPDIVSSSTPSASAMLERTLKSANGVVALDEVASKRLLKAYGIPVSKEEIAQTAAEAVKIAKTIGFPVGGKSVSADILPQIRYRWRGTEPQQRRRSEKGLQRHHRAGQEAQEQAQA